MSSRQAFPALGRSLPHSGGPLSRAFGRAMLGALGWHFEGQLPDVPKGVLIVAPHTSNWDWVVGIAGKLSLGVDAKWLGKDTIFRGVLGPLMRWLGGIPVDRSAPHGVVSQCISRFEAADRMLLGVTPEGTRKEVPRWKTGFYHIAQGAGVPIIPVAFDWPRRALVIGPSLAPTANMDADFDALSAFFSSARGRRGERTPPPR